MHASSDETAVKVRNAGYLKLCVIKMMARISHRLTASMLSQVDYYGAPTPLRQIANLSAPEASLLVIQPYDKSSIPSIEKAIMTSDLNMNPNSDGNLIRINVPQLTAVRGCTSLP